jgi:peptidyl-prolyl cis-trans isomerase A (cyclophilin A)
VHRTRRILTLAALLAFGAVAAMAALAAWPPQEAGHVRAVIQTELGEIEVELDAARAPVTVANFLRYVDAGYYTGGVFHRTVKLKPDNQPNNTVKIEVIQAGPNPGRKELIQQSPVEAQRLTPAVKILRIRRAG